MQDKILSVFYGEDRLPYKDASRETHYPIVNGNVFNGANNVTKIRYYLDRIGGFANVTWVVVSKLPNGQIASEVLNSNNAVYDEELGENYVEFEISSYYTTLKGDVYLSLQGYQGGVEVEQDEDTGIYSIYGTPTIQATGSIKIGVNYAPQIFQGTHFTTSDLQQVLGLISDKANIDNVFIVLDDISTSDLSSYDDGQLFYDKATQCFYIWNYASETYSRYDRMLYYCPSSYLQLSEISNRYSNLWVSYIDSGDFIVAKVTTGYSVNAYRFGANGTVNCYVASGQSGDTTLHTIISGTPTYSYAKQSELVYTRGDYLVVDTDTTTIADIYSNVDTSETFRVGGSNVLLRGTYLLEKGSDLGSNYNFKITCVEHNSVDMIGKYWETTLGGVAPTTTLTTIFNNLANTPATTTYVDNKIADFMQKEYQNVNTTTYPTLDDFLASTGTEGYIYLYPTGVNNDYYQYIWENNGWVSLGTTQLELSNYYTKDEVDTELDTKQDTLVSGTNIKTLNGASLLGSGNIEYDNKFDKVSTNPVQNQKITNSLLDISTNLINPAEVTPNAFLSRYNEQAQNATRCYTGFLPVEPGQVITAQQGGLLATGLIFQVTAFNLNKEYAGSSYGSSATNAYTVPDGIYFIKVSFNNNANAQSLVNNKIAIVVGNTNVPYQDYGAIKIKDSVLDFNKNNFHDVFEDDGIEIDDIAIAKSRNLFNKNAPLANGFIYNGNVVASQDHYTSDYIKVKPNTTYSFTQQEGVTDNVRFACTFDIAKRVIANYTESPATITTPDNCYYIRISFYKENVNRVCMKEGTPIGFFTPYAKQVEHQYVSKAFNFVAFLPKDIYCAVGRTIELYNKQVCLSADKYNIRWRCPVGGAFERKFSVTGTAQNIGTYKLQFAMYDDDMVCVYYAQSTLHIVNDAINTEYKLCPIGDSLTELGHFWQEQLYNLNNNVKTVGTRTSSNTHNNKHEGRSGWTAEYYLTLSANAGKTNSFFNPSTQKFDYAYYKSTYNISPDVIQIFLGTNDLLNYSQEEFAEYIGEMIESIRENDATIPIMIVFTITWSNQDGIGVEGNVRTQHGRFKYNLDKTYIDGIKCLYDYIEEQEYSNVFFVPMTQCFDSEYNFGWVETPVNPHATQTTHYPIEAVHPQEQGYMQFADIIYSVLCYIKSL